MKESLVAQNVLSSQKTWETMINQSGNKVELRERTHEVRRRKDDGARTTDAPEEACGRGAERSERLRCKQTRKAERPRRQRIEKMRFDQTRNSDR